MVRRIEVGPWQPAAAATPQLRSWVHSQTAARVTAPLLGVAHLASAVPVWRAVRADPRVVLEAE